MIKIELDDFRTDEKLIDDIRRLKADCNVQITLYALLGLCDPNILRDLKSEFEVNLHGWNHFSESRWGYWEMRHFLEYAVYLELPLFLKSPWNRFPKFSATRAMIEADCCLVTPRKSQVWIARMIGLQTQFSNNLVVHPIDLVDHKMFLKENYAIKELM